MKIPNGEAEYEENGNLKIRTTKSGDGVKRRMPKFDTYAEYMMWRLDRRVEVITARVARVKRGYMEWCKHRNVAPGEEDRRWLDQFAVGNGLDIAAGDFLCGDGESALGVDGHERMIATDYWSEGDELTFAEPGQLDFIVTNYLDGFPNPLKALNEWYRTLRVGGTIAIVVRDADQYDFSKGPLENLRRQSSFTHKTICHYLFRAGFKEVKFDTNNKDEKVIRVHAKKHAKD